MPGVFDTSFTHIRNAFPLITTQPSLVSAKVFMFGTRLRLTFSRPVTGNTVPTLSMSGGAVTCTYLSGSGTEVIYFSLSRTVETIEIGTLDLAAGSYEADTGWFNLEQLAFPVSFVIPPFVSGGGSSQFELLSELVGGLTSELIGRRGGGAAHGIDGYYAFDPVGELELGDDVDLVYTDFSVEGEFSFVPGSPSYGGSVSLVWTPAVLTYQHYRDGVAIPGATSPTLSLTNIDENDNGSYTIRVTNPTTGKSRTFGPLSVGVSGVSGGPVAPEGFALVIDDESNYVVDDEGNNLIAEEDS